MYSASWLNCGKVLQNLTVPLTPVQDVLATTEMLAKYLNNQRENWAVCFLLSIKQNMNDLNLF